MNHQDVVICLVFVLFKTLRSKLLRFEAISGLVIGYI